MKNTFACLLLLFLSAFPLTAQAQKIYVNGVDPNFPPFAYIDNNSGQPTGLDIEAMDWIANTMDIQIIHKPVAWDTAIPSLLAGEIDMLCSGMSTTPVHAVILNFSDPYWTASPVFVTRVDSDLTPHDILSGNIPLGALNGARETAAIRKEQMLFGYPFELRLYESIAQIVDNLLGNHIQAGIMEKLLARNAIDDGAEIRIAGSCGAREDFAVALRKNDGALLKIVNEGFRKLKDDPYWKVLLKKYLSQAVLNAPPRTK
ncbi:MAG: ABC transporter substrate-binding protein [Desulfovibrio sp.]|nr:ABC transporter substrate-binding protein [Desulfovibrio sp.]